MEKTRSKSKANFMTINVMAALLSVLLLVGIFYSHAGAASATPDIQVNGMDNTVTLASENTLTVTVQLNAGEQTGEQADWWIIAATPMGWYYYEYPDKWYLSGVSMEDLGFAYHGDNFHGAGAVRFNTKVEGGPASEGGERCYNYVRLVRDADN